MANGTMKQNGRMKYLACSLAAGLGALLFAGPTHADDAIPPPPAMPEAPMAAPPLAPPPTPVMPSAPAMPAPAPAAPAAFVKSVGGHIGIATSFVTLKSHTETISDRFGIAAPIGIGFKVSENLAVDFEMVVSNDLKPKPGSSGLTVDPGIVYNWGAFATGLRGAVKIGQLSNVGLIPLINKGLVDMGGATWFIEAAFPTFVQDKKLSLDMVLHTGVGF